MAHVGKPKVPVNNLNLIPHHFVPAVGIPTDPGPFTCRQRKNHQDGGLRELGPSRRRVFVAQPAFPHGNEHHSGHHPTATTHNNKQKQGRLAERAAAVEVICLAPQKTTALAASINATPVMHAVVGAGDTLSAA